VAFGRIDHQDSFLACFGALLIGEANEHKSKTSASLSGPIAHNDCVDYLSKAGEVGMKMFLSGGEGQAANEQFNLILLGWLVERCSRTDNLLGHSHLWEARHTHPRHCKSSESEGARLLQKVHLRHATSPLHHGNHLGHLHWRGSCSHLRHHGHGLPHRIETSHPLQSCELGHLGRLELGNLLINQTWRGRTTSCRGCRSTHLLSTFCRWGHTFTSSHYRSPRRLFILLIRHELLNLLQLS